MVLIKDATTEIRWCPAHKGVEGNKVADERAKLAIAEPDAWGVRRETGHCKSFKIRDLFADGRCCQAILHFFLMTQVRMRV